MLLMKVVVDAKANNQLNQKFTKKQKFDYGDDIKL